RYVHVQLIEQAYRVARPSDRHRRDGEQVLEHQVPADEPGDPFAEGGVRVGVRAPRRRYHRGELSVAQACEGAADARDDEGERQGGTGVIGGGGAGEHEDARADDAADAEQCEVQRAEGAAQLIGGLLFVQDLDRLGRKKLPHRRPPIFRLRTLHKRPRESESAPAARAARSCQPSRSSAGRCGASSSRSAAYTCGVPARMCPAWRYSPPLSVPMRPPASWTSSVPAAVSHAERPISQKASTRPAAT